MCIVCGRRLQSAALLFYIIKPYTAADVCASLMNVVTVNMHMGIVNKIILVL